MIFDLFGPRNGSRGRDQICYAVAHPIHASNSHTKFGLMSSNGFGGDSIKVGRMNRILKPRHPQVATLTSDMFCIFNL